MPASGSDLRVALVPEVTYGVTPATPAFAILRTTGGGLQTNKSTVQSEERQFHQNLIDELQVAQDVEGSYEFEMSHASFDTLIEAVMGGAWASNVIRNGVTQRSFTIEEFLELGATDSFRRFGGCMVDTMQLTMTAREKITGSFGIVGRNETLAAAIVSGATYTNPNAEVVMTGSGSVGTLTVGSITPLRIRRAQINVNRNLRRVNSLGSIHSDLMNNGLCLITGEIEAYFENNGMLQAVLNHETAALSFTIGHDANKRYTIAIPRARFGNAAVAAGGNAEDLMQTIPFTATLVTTPENHSMQITRAVA